MVNELTNLVEEKEEMKYWDSMPTETGQEYFAKVRTMSPAQHKVTGTVLGTYFYTDHTLLRFDDPYLEVSIPHEVGLTDYYEYLGIVKISRSMVTVGIDARGLNGVPEVRYLEGPQMKKIIPQR